jgi:hypothetical protein
MVLVILGETEQAIMNDSRIKDLLRKFRLGFSETGLTQKYYLTLRLI